MDVCAALVDVLEGNYMDFGSNSGIVAGIPVTAKATESNVLVGVNYHFF